MRPLIAFLDGLGLPWGGEGGGLLKFMYKSNLLCAASCWHKILPLILQHKAFNACVKIILHLCSHDWPAVILACTAGWLEACAIALSTLPCPFQMSCHA